MVTKPFVPARLVGRQAELNQMSQVLAEDGDLLVAGVPGSGRHTLVRSAARRVGAKVIEIDCLRATHSHRFLELLTEGILAAFADPAEFVLIQQWSMQHPVGLERSPSGSMRLVWQPPTDEWMLFQQVLALPQAIAEALQCRVVILFQNFPHIRSWDRSEQWETYLRQEIQRQSRVSYALIATVAESWVQQSEMQVVFLGPLKPEDLQPWLIETLEQRGLRFEPAALELFLETVQGNFGDAIALLRRLWLDQDLRGQRTVLNETPHSDLEPNSQPLQVFIHPHQVHRSAIALVEDLSLTFESLLLLLPPSQVRVLESLALDPTDSPHSREYIQKHHLSRGGGLQGALASLQQKGLVYGPECHYRITMPLLALWLKNRLA